VELIGATLLILSAYLLGSVPVGFIFGALSGVDVRHRGSGNVGATNVARVVGKLPGLLTLLGDMAKGFIPVFFSSWLGFGLLTMNLVAVAAFLGHLYPVFLKFHGGKGVATALGVFLALAPEATGALAVVFLIVALWSRLVSLASVVAAALAPVVFWALSYPPGEVWLGLVIGLMVIVRHRENIRRLISGTEPKFHL